MKPHLGIEIMPIYDFRCNTCRKRFEVFISYQDYGQVPVHCPHCKSDQVSRLINRVRIAAFRAVTGRRYPLEDVITHVVHGGGHLRNEGIIGCIETGILQCSHKRIVYIDGAAVRIETVVADHRRVLLQPRVSNASGGDSAFDRAVHFFP